MVKSICIWYNHYHTLNTMSYIMEDVLSRSHFLETLLMFNIESIYANKGKKRKIDVLNHDCHCYVQLIFCF